VFVLGGSAICWRTLFAAGWDKKENKEEKEMEKDKKN